MCDTAGLDSGRISPIVGHFHWPSPHCHPGWNATDITNATHKVRTFVRFNETLACNTKQTFIKNTLKNLPIQMHKLFTYVKQNRRRNIAASAGEAVFAQKSVHHCEIFALEYNVDLQFSRAKYNNFKSTPDGLELIFQLHRCSCCCSFKPVLLLAKVSVGLAGVSPVWHLLAYIAYNTNVYNLGKSG